MRRRAFLASAAMWPMAAQAQLTPRDLDGGIYRFDLTDVPLFTPWGFLQNRLPFAAIKTADQTYAYSYQCTHKGCIMMWRAQTRDWFCPCFGSAYGIDGVPTKGPATEALSPAAVSIRDNILTVPDWADPILPNRVQIIG